MDTDESRENGVHGGGPFAGSLSRHRHGQLKKRRWLFSPLWIGIVLEGVIIAGLLIWLALLNQDNQASSEREHKLIQEVKNRDAQVEGLKFDINQLKNNMEQSCQHDMLPLKLDQVMEINKEYVKSALFLMVGKKDKKYLNYTIILQNLTHKDVTPQVDVTFFNATGSQIGVSQVGRKSDGSFADRTLEHGEVRSFDGTFELLSEAKPEFFMLQVK